MEVPHDPWDPRSTSPDPGLGSEAGGPHPWAKHELLTHRYGVPLAETSSQTISPPGNVSGHPINWVFPSPQKSKPNTPPAPRTGSQPHSGHVFGSLPGGPWEGPVDGAPATITHPPTARPNLKKTMETLPKRPTRQVPKPGSSQHGLRDEARQTAMTMTNQENKMSRSTPCLFGLLTASARAFAP